MPGRVTILGLTFKENVPDIRNSKVVDIVRELQAFGIAVQVHDPIAIAQDALREYAIELIPESALLPADAVILAVPHTSYVAAGWPLITRLLQGNRGIVLDLKAKLDRSVRPDGIDLWRL